MEDKFKFKQPKVLNKKVSFQYSGYLRSCDQTSLKKVLLDTQNADERTTLKMSLFYVEMCQ